MTGNVLKNPWFPAKNGYCRLGKKNKKLSQPQKKTKSLEKWFRARGIDRLVHVPGMTQLTVTASEEHGHLDWHEACKPWRLTASLYPPNGNRENVGKLCLTMFNQLIEAYPHFQTWRCPAIFVRTWRHVGPICVCQSSSIAFVLASTVTNSASGIPSW